MNYKLDDLTVEELTKGYVELESGDYQCTVCGAQFDRLEIFQIEGRFYTAEKQVAHHVESVHGGAITVLLEADKKYAVVTERQKTILVRMASGQSDKQIASDLQLAPSTVRQTRFAMKAKARQAKMVLALNALIFDNESKGDALVPVHAHATMVDDRYALTVDEEREILEKFFISIEPLKLKTFSSKEKKKLVILRKITSILEKNRTYTESELNAILETIYSDYVTIRRYLIEYGFLDRVDDGSAYWLKE
ncbi:DUF2087 domain-containing protein [Fusibacter sp. JL298sf-3]